MRRWMVFVSCALMVWLMLWPMLWIGGVPVIYADTTVVSVVRSDSPLLKEQVSPDQELTRQQIEEVVRGAMRELGGMEAFVKPDHRWVVIKPNIVQASARGSGDITDAYVVWALVRLVHEANPSARISIAEGAAEWISPGRRWTRYRSPTDSRAADFDRSQRTLI